MLAEWVSVEVDLHLHFGIDLGDREMLRRRTWRWLRLRVLALASIEGTRLQRVLRPDLTPRTG